MPVVFSDPCNQYVGSLVMKLLNNELEQDLQKIFFRTDNKLLIKHIEDLNISQEFLNSSLDQLEKWFNNQPHLPNIEKDDPFILRTLYGCSFSVEKTKTKLENLFTARSLKPEFFEKRDPCSIETSNIMSCVEWAILPKLTKEGCRITTLRIKNSDVSKYVPLESFKLMLALVDLRMRYDSTFNDVIIADMGYTQFGHCLKVNPIILKNIITIIKNCYVHKVKAIHIINLPTYGAHLIKAIKKIISTKIGDRLNIYDNVEDFHKVIPVEYLPIEMGGTAGSTREYSDNLYKALQTTVWRPVLMDIVKQKTNESMRPNDQQQKINDLFGIDGSFRKLDID